jgi:hypothetical protein
MPVSPQIQCSLAGCLQLKWKNLVLSDRTVWLGNTNLGETGGKRF